jgi:hypothetical protein
VRVVLVEGGEDLELALDGVGGLGEECPGGLFAEDKALAAVRGGCQ